MISQPGDKRMALIAVLIAVPVSALITMGVHTFVKNGDTAVSYPQQTGFSAQQKGGHRHHGSGARLIVGLVSMNAICDFS